MIVIDIGCASAIPHAVNPELPRDYGESGEEGDFKKNQVEMEALVGISICDNPSCRFFPHSVYPDIDARRAANRAK